MKCEARSLLQERRSNRSIDGFVTGPLILVLVAYLFVACGSPPIPTAIIEGTTGTITLPAAAIVGYGRVWSGVTITDPADWADSMNPALAPPYTIPTAGLEDIQRGEMILILSKIELNGTTTDVTRLPVRFISRAKIDSTTNFELDPSAPVRKGQVVIVFDVPPGLVSDAEETRDLWVRVERYRRDLSGSWGFIQLPVVAASGASSTELGWGWSNGGSAAHPIPITVADHPAADAAEPAAGENFTPRAGWGVVYECPGGFFCGLYSKVTPFFELLNPDYIPNAQFSILTSSTTVHPAAWEFDVQYPAQRMWIKGVTLERKMPGQAYLDWSAPDPPPQGDCTASTETLNIKIVDPESRTRGVNVVFGLLNILYACSPPPPVVESHLQVAQQTAVAYDIDGNPIAFPALEPADFGDN